MLVNQFSRSLPGLGLRRGRAPPQYIIINKLLKLQDTGTCKLQSLIVGHWPVTGRDYAPIVSLLLELNWVRSGEGLSIK